MQANSDHPTLSQGRESLRPVVNTYEIKIWLKSAVDIKLVFDTCYSFCKKHKLEVMITPTTFITSAGVWPAIIVALASQPGNILTEAKGLNLAQRLKMISDDIATICTEKTL